MTDDTDTPTPPAPSPTTGTAAAGGPPPSDDPPESAADRRKRRVELAGAIIIGIAAVLTAFATYFGAKVDGQVQEKNTDAITNVLVGNDYFNDATAARAIERDWIFSFLEASFYENEDLTGFLVDAMPDEVFALADEWQNSSDDILNPFSPEAEETYVSAGLLPSVDLLIEGIATYEAANCAFFESGVAEIRGDNYGLSTVFLAISLVVGGIAALLKGKSAQIIVLTTATISLILGAGVLALATDADQARAEHAANFFDVDDGGNELSAEQSLALADEVCPQSEE